MKNLVLSSIAAFLLAGCTLGHYGQLQERKNPTFKSPLPKPIFAHNFNSFLFRTNITVYGKNYSGLLVTKQMSPKNYRVIFTTELGMKLFDFEFRDTAFTLHYCVPQFNDPRILKIIQKDIETLLMNDLGGKEALDFEDKKGVYAIKRVKSGNRYNYYFTEKASQRLVKIEHSKKRIKKTTFTLSDHQNSFPGRIIIKHHDIRLKIELNLLKK